MELVSDRLIQEVRTEAAKKIDRELELDIMGCDIDARMVEIAKANAQAAGVVEEILPLSKCAYRTCAQTRLMA